MRAGGVGDADNAEVLKRPHTAPGGARFGLECQHLADRSAIIGKAVDPRKAAAQHFTLNPRAGLIVQMGERPTVTIDAAAAVGQGQAPPQSELRQRRLGLLRQRFDAEPRAPQGQIGRHDADQTNAGSVVEDQGIAVDDLHGDAATAAGQLARRCCGRRPKDNCQERRQA